MSKKNQEKIKSLWKKGRNVWEISQLTGLSEESISAFVRA